MIEGLKKVVLEIVPSETEGEPSKYSVTVVTDSETTDTFDTIDAAFSKIAEVVGIKSTPAGE